jgi:type VI protein secretion system component VasF
MRPINFLPRWAAIVLVVGSLAAISAQQATPPPRMTPLPGTINTRNSPEDNNDPEASKMAAEQGMRRNTLRQKEIVDDTTKLLTLAQQLKVEVDKSNKDMLSIAVVKKAEEIEKLAKSVKEKMRAGL